MTTTKTTADALYAAATAAGYAPSIHNTQPWRWRLDGDVLDLFLDRSRALDVTDPDARMAILSCGAALHHARIALAGLGRQAVVERLPDPTAPDHLARVRVDGQCAVDPGTVRLVQTIRERHTDRRPAGTAPVSEEALRAITVAAEAQQIRLHILRHDQILDLAAITGRAQDAETAETQWQDEVARWTGANRPAGAGVPDAVIPATAPQTTVPGRDFGHHGALSGVEGHDESAVFGVLYGPGGDPVDWLRAGEALSATWLTATVRRIALLPLSAPVEVDGVRAAVRRLVADLGEPYLAMRLSVAVPYPDGAEHTPRLPAEQIIDRQP